MSVIHSRALLFVPGTRSDRFAKAEASGTDAVIIDLEDAVADADKTTARLEAARWARSHSSAAVRVNAYDSVWFAGDIASLVGTGCTIVVPKCESARPIAEIMSADSTFSVVPLIETARGVLDAVTIAGSGAARLAIGNIDLATELGIDAGNRLGLQAARSALVLASACAGLPAPIDGVTPEFGDPATVIDDSRYAASLGFGGKLCIHPSQVEPVKAAFSPSIAQVEWARQVLAASDGTKSVIAGADQMIDRPVIARARQVIAQSKAHS